MNPVKELKETEKAGLQVFLNAEKSEAVRQTESLHLDLAKFESLNQTFVALASTPIPSKVSDQRAVLSENKELEHSKSIFADMQKIPFVDINKLLYDCNEQDLPFGDLNLAAKTMLRQVEELARVPDQDQRDTLKEILGKLTRTEATSKELNEKLYEELEKILPQVTMPSSLQVRVIQPMSIDDQLVNSLLSPSDILTCKIPKKEILPTTTIAPNQETVDINSYFNSKENYLLRCRLFSQYYLLDLDESFLVA